MVAMVFMREVLTADVDNAQLGIRLERMFISSMLKGLFFYV